MNERKLLSPDLAAFIIRKQPRSEGSPGRYLMLGKDVMHVLAIFLLGGAVGVAAQQTPIQELGDEIFEDADLSINNNQSCASCHDDAWGSTGPDSFINAHGAVYEGSIPGAFGDRKPPETDYATLSPVLHFDGDAWVGGNFWDGRATGEKLGWPSADQAQGPFLNLKEQALPDNACVVFRVSVAAYALLYEEVFGDNIFTIDFPGDADLLCANGDPVPLSAGDRAKVETEYDNIALAIAEYEAAPSERSFSSKFDAALRGQYRLTRQERRGFALFQGKAGCKRCHPSNGQLAAFTDFTYDNLGVPSNPENPVLWADPDFRDPGLGGFLESRGEPEEVWMPELGKMKVPTLRNVGAKPTPESVKAYAHNGYFKSLKGIVHFYNTRDVKPECPNPLTTMEDAIALGCWPAPEIAANVNTSELGDLGLTDAEEDAIVEFLETLTDDFF
jgi:cytochrome c peroxidase